jgi:hypothetical protein
MCIKGMVTLKAEVSLQAEFGALYGALKDFLRR